ncbi:MAG TPA: hypothetical protein VG841_14660 [Caulobacterales bacterium]|nr:hypothetical protein [Caulobacterales bacterium]
MAKIALTLVGLVCLVLGGLWFLQGLGVVRMQPVLCVADCAPLEGPSLTWTTVGFVVAGAGCVAIVRALRPRA